MIRAVVISLFIVVAFNSYSFVYDVPILYKIIGHGLFMPSLAIFYGVCRKWQFGLIDKLIFLCCLIGGICDVVIFFDLNEKGEFLQIVFNFFVHLVFIIIFRIEGAYVFNIAKTNILKVLVPALITFFFFGYVLMTALPNLIYFVAILYAVEITILVVLGYYRPVKDKNYWVVASGVTIIMLRDILYCYFFYIYKGTHPLLYVPLYWTNAIGYFLIIYGIARNQNFININYEKISLKAIISAFKNVFHVYKKGQIKSQVYETLFMPHRKYIAQNLDEA